MAIYSKYLLKEMIHRFGFWHANGKPRKEEMNTTSLKIGAFGHTQTMLKFVQNIQRSPWC